jgi:HK97 family phage major capsid protein
MGTGTTTGTKLIIAGDFQAGYLIADRLGMSVELVPHLFGATSRFPKGQRGLFAIWRTGGGVLAQNAFRYLEVK